MHEREPRNVDVRIHTIARPRSHSHSHSSDDDHKWKKFADCRRLLEVSVLLFISTRPQNYPHTSTNRQKAKMNLSLRNVLSSISSETESLDRKCLRNIVISVNWITLFRTSPMRPLCRDIEFSSVSSFSRRHHRCAVLLTALEFHSFAHTNTTAGRRVRKRNVDDSDGTNLS